MTDSKLYKSIIVVLLVLIVILIISLMIYAGVPLFLHNWEVINSYWNTP